MAYKNSDGNSSIANQWGQWRYFNSALDKLGTAKPATVTINENNVTIPEADNWMDSVTAVIKGIRGGMEAKKELSYKLADDYLKNHSLEEYRDQMVKGLVPFQDDPLAMARLKESHGQMVFQYITDDFQRRVDSNEFKGMSSEQVDAEFFKYARQQSADIAETFGYSENDVFFNRGLFTNSPTERVKMMARQKEVEHNFNVQDMFVTESAKIHALIQNGADGIAIIDGLRSVEQTVGRFLDPEKRNKLYTSIVQSLENSPNGIIALQQLADTKNLPLSNGLTLREFLGEDGYKASFIKAFNHAYSQDAQSKFNYQQGLSNLAEAGNLSILEGLLGEEYQNTNNTDTDKTKDIKRYIERAKTVQRINLNKTYAETKKQFEDQQKLNLATRYLSDASVPFADMKSVSSMDLSKGDLKKAFDIMIDNGYPLDNVLNIASNPSIPRSDNVARTFLSDRASAGISYLKGEVNEYLRNGNVPKEPSKYLTQTLEAYKANPEKFAFACGTNSEEVREVIALNTMLDAGVPYQDVIKSMAGRKKESENPNYNITLRAIKNSVLNSVSGVELTGSEEYNLDSTGKTFITAMAFKFLGTGKCDSTADAINKAKEAYSKHYYSVRGMSIPKGFFAGTYGEAGFTQAKKVLKSKMEKFKGSNARYVEGADLNTSYIVFEDDAGRYVGHLSPLDINKDVGEIINKEREEAEELLRKPSPLSLNIHEEEGY